MEIRWRLGGDEGAFAVKRHRVIGIRNLQRGNSSARPPFLKEVAEVRSRRIKEERFCGD